jgi:hypothetical protein
MNMAYSNKFVVAIIKDGKFLKELNNGSVPIEFNSEYTIRLRNKHHKRAICKLFIDGENVSEGGFIIGANSHVDIERPANVSKKFKFVDLNSDEAHDFGKNGPNHDKTKGLIEAHFALESEMQLVPYVPYIPTTPWKPYNPFEPRWINPQYLYTSHGSAEPNTKQTMYGSKASLNSLTLRSISLDCCSYNPPDQSQIEAKCDTGLRDGATVEGSQSSQRFSSTYFQDDGNWTTIKVFLQGFDPVANSPYYLSINSANKPTWAKLPAENSVDDDQEILELKLKVQALKKAKRKAELEKELKELEAEISN